MNKVFINETFTEAINNYLAHKEDQKGIVYNSFLVVCIRILIVIYNETDIINPFTSNNEEILKNNLIKFGYSLAKVEEFFQLLDNFKKVENQNTNLSIKKDNPYFIEIQKRLVDMLMTKKINFHTTDEEIKEFYNLLYTPDNKEPLMISYNYLTAKDHINDVKKYFLEQLKLSEPVEEEATKNYLNNRSYEIMGYKMEDIKKLSSEQLEKMNHQVYDYFKIRENAINKEYLLEKAIEEHDNPKTPLTTGNGYVDILLVMGAICTLVMVGVIVKFLVF